MTVTGNSANAAVIQAVAMDVANTLMTTLAQRAGVGVDTLFPFRALLLQRLAVQEPSAAKGGVNVASIPGSRGQLESVTSNLDGNSVRVDGRTVVTTPSSSAGTVPSRSSMRMAVPSHGARTTDGVSIDRSTSSSHISSNGTSRHHVFTDKINASYSPVPSPVNGSVATTLSEPVSSTMVTDGAKSPGSTGSYASTGNGKQVVMRQLNICRR